MEVASSPTFPTISNPSYFHLLSPVSLSFNSGYTSSSEARVPSDSGTKAEDEGLNDWLEELKKEANKSRDEALSELLMRQNLEAEAVEAISKVNYFCFKHQCASLSDSLSG